MSANLRYTRFKINALDWIVKADEGGISEIQINKSYAVTYLSDEWQESDEYFEEVKRQLTEYFEGKRTHFDLKLNPKGTEYQKKVWNALLQIPYGETRSYKEVAEMCGNPKASRAVGLANNRNPIPIIIPCHRVIGSDKRLTGYALGMKLKQNLIHLEKINLIFGKLKNHFGDISKPAWGGQKSWWPSEKPFDIMLGAILVQNTNWNNVDQALKALGAECSPQKILALSTGELAALIRPAGFQNQKAEKLKALCAWMEQYEFSMDALANKALPKLREELLSVHGVGKETADAILLYALRKTSFVIDAYARRIFSRVGIEVPRQYDDFQAMIEKAVPADVQTYDTYHGLIVEHAKTFCRKNPHCSGCPLETICQKTGVSAQMSLEF